ncbi:MAG: hypothetical protein VB082_03925 [Christensenella sp.]|nr:hypothetical protein [Christensenella sp.]
MKKNYVDVIARFSREGTVRPIALVSEWGSKYEISRVTKCVPAASLKNGVLGMRYTCYIGVKMFYLYLEDGERWFLEPA